MRDGLNKKKRIVSLSSIGAFILMFASLIIVPSYSIYIILIGFPVFMFTIFYAHYGIKCSKCKGNIGILVMHLGSPFTSSKNIKYCPFCGVNIDTGINKNLS